MPSKPDWCSAGQIADKNLRKQVTRFIERTKGLAEKDDVYGDVVVDLRKSKAHYEEWLAKAKPAPGPGGLRRPRWLPRPLKPVDSEYVIGE